MTHKEVLNLILSQACPSDESGEEREFQLTLCCKQVQIKAKLIKDDAPYGYEITDVKID